MRYESLALIIVLASSPSLAQRKVVRTETKPTRPTPVALEREPPPYNLKLKIGEGPKLFLSIVSFADSDEIFPSYLDSLINDLSGDAIGSDSPGRAFPRVVVEANPNITMLDFWNPITRFPLGRAEVSLFLPNVDVLAVLPVPEDDPVDVKPNPLCLFVTVDEGGKLSLNNEPAGSLSDTQPLGDRLRGVFKERETNGVLHEGTNSIETAVTIIMPMSQRKFSDLITIAEIVKKAGSGWISIMMKNNDPIDMRKDLLDALPSSPLDAAPVVPRKKKPRH